MTGIGRNQLDRTTAVIGKKRKIAKRSVPEDDDLESISDKNEDGNGDYLIGDEGAHTLAQTVSRLMLQR